MKQMRQRLTFGACLVHPPPRNHALLSGRTSAGLRHILRVHVVRPSSSVNLNSKKAYELQIRACQACSGGGRNGPCSHIPEVPRIQLGLKYDRIETCDLVVIPSAVISERPLRRALEGLPTQEPATGAAKKKLPEKHNKDN